MNLPVDITILDGPGMASLLPRSLVRDLREAEDVEHNTGIIFSCLKKRKKTHYS
jgi:hypothetical protein